MFNMAEVWGLRPDGSNPCRHIPKYPENGHTRLITDDELVKLFHYLDRAEREQLEHPTIMLAVRLQFEFAARMSEIINLQWDWIDFAKRRVAWPDSKTGGMSKPMSEESHRLLTSVRRYPGSPYVCPAPGGDGYSQFRGVSEGRDGADGPQDGDDVHAVRACGGRSDAGRGGAGVGEAAESGGGQSAGGPAKCRTVH
jgi:integrase